MKMVSDSLIKVVGFRPYRFQDKDNQKEICGVTLYYIFSSSEDEIKSGFLGDKCGVCNVPGDHPLLCVGCSAKLVFEDRMFKGECKTRVVDVIVQPK